MEVVKMVSVGHVVPSKSKIEIEIPADYINKEIEILIFPIEKTQKKQPKKESILSLQGILGNVAYEPEMKKKAWESAVEEKFLLD
jgi:hypothetical protein